MSRHFRFLTAVAFAHLLCVTSVAQLAPSPSLITRAASGDATAMHLLGRAAAAERMPVEAYAWFTLATEYGVETSEKAQILDTLTAEQVRAATQRIAEIKARELAGLPPPAPKPVASIVVARPAIEERPAATPAVTPAKPLPASDSRVEEATARIAKLEADLAEASAASAKLREETARLQASLAQSSRERDALSGEIATLRKDKLSAEESLAQLRAKPTDKGQVEAQRTQIAKLESDLAAARAEARDAKASSTEAAGRLEAALALATKERDARAAEIASLRQDKQTAEETLAQLRARPSLEGKVKEQEAQIAKLGADLAAARSDASAVKAASLQETQRLEAALAQAKKESEVRSGEVAALRQDKQHAEEALAQLRARPSLDGKVKEQEVQIVKLETDLSTALADNRAALARSGEVTTRLEAALAQATKERDGLSGEVAQLRRDKLSAEESLAQLRARPALDGKLEEQRTQIAKLESDLAAARAEARSAKAEAAEATTRLEAALAKANQDRAAEPVEVAKLRQERLAAEQARDQLRVEFAATRSKLESDLTAARNEARVAKAYAAKLEAELAAARGESRSGSSQFGEDAGIQRAAPSRSPVAQPVAVPVPALPRVHTVASGETLSSVSQRYYGSPNRWQEIFDANRDVLNSPNQLALGTRLRIP